MHVFEINKMLASSCYIAINAIIICFHYIFESYLPYNMSCLKTKNNFYLNFLRPCPYSTMPLDPQ